MYYTSDIIKSFIKNLVFSFIACLLTYFAIKWIGSWYREELTTMAVLLLLVFIPIGFAAFTTGGDETLSRLIRWGGFLLIVIPTLIHHINMFEIAETYVRVEATILPIAWIVSTLTYIQIGYDIFGYWVRFSLVYVFVLTMIVNMMFSGLGVLIFYLIAGGIALLYLAYIRIKEGSAFAC